MNRKANFKKSILIKIRIWISSTCIWSFASYIILRSGSWNFNFADTSWYIHNRKVNFKIEFHSFYFLWIFSPHVPCRFIVLWNLKWQFRSTWSQNKWFLWALPIIYFLIIVFISPLAEWWVYWNTLVRPSLNLVYVTSHLLDFIHIWYLGWPWSEHAHIIPISRMVDFCESYSPFHVCLTIHPSAYLVYATSHLSFVAFYSYLVSWLAMIWACACYTDFMDGWFLWEL
jgi:hypothetical protein